MYVHTLVTEYVHNLLCRIISTYVPTNYLVKGLMYIRRVAELCRWGLSQFTIATNINFSPWSWIGLHRLDGIICVKCGTYLIM